MTSSARTSLRVQFGLLAGVGEGVAMMKAGEPAGVASLRKMAEGVKNDRLVQLI